jgi:hypothetical protein
MLLIPLYSTYTENDTSGGNVSNQYSRDASSTFGQTPTFTTEWFYVSPQSLQAQCRDSTANLEVCHDRFLQNPLKFKEGNEHSASFEYK